MLNCTLSFSNFEYARFLKFLNHEPLFLICLPIETLKSRFETARLIKTARFLKLHVFWNFQIQRLLGPQLMCWSHCFTELEATASNTLNITHHQWINSVQQNINFGGFHFSFLSTHKDCFSNAKQGGAELSSLPALYWQKPSNLFSDYCFIFIVVSLQHGFIICACIIAV